MAPSVDRGKLESAREVAGRQPMVHYWDWEEPRLLVCEAEFVAVADSQDSNATGTDGNNTNKPVGVQAVSSAVLLFYFKDVRKMI